MNQPQDIGYMHMAYGLAEKAVGRAGPNPNVGAVVINQGKVVGYGFHERPGKPHAEVIALERAGKQAEGGTIYITLEPCTHWGRTPPCVGKLLQAKLKRAVISAFDPNPIVFQNGARALSQNGIPVSVGLLKEKNRILNAAYNKFITREIPYITLKAALSLDGKSATRNHDSQWISLPETREYIHLLRGEHDAVLVGIQTVLADNPRLTVRHSNWPGKKITRVILDSFLKIPESAKIIRTLNKGRILIAASSRSDPEKRERLEQIGIEIVLFDTPGPHIPLNDLLVHLGKEGVSSLLVEGGGTVHSAFLDSGLADRIFITLSPLLIGGEDAPAFFKGRGVDNLKNALRIKTMESFRIEDDLVIEGYF